MELPRPGKAQRKVPKLSMQQVHDNQETLKRINRKIDFQKNPRYQNITSHKYSQALNSGTMSLAKQNRGAFRCEPSEIVFSNFQKDVIYEFEVILVNTSKLLRRIKVTPIASEEFVVSEIKYPNENSGDIASGMKVTIVVRFFPKQIKNYQSELVVFSEDSVLKIPIYTIRDEPQLVYKQTIDCGSCWIDNTINIVQKIMNKGGEAYFNLVSNSGTAEDNKLKFNHFQISPISFKLGKNQQIILNITYKSLVETSSSQKIIITSQYFSGNKELSFNITGSSFKPHIQLLSLNNTKCQPSIKNHKIYFQDITPNVESLKTLAIKNLTNLNLTFNWNLQNSSEVYKINEMNGVFKPLQIKQFTISYDSPFYLPSFGNAKIFIRQNSTENHEPEYQFQIVSSPQKFITQISPQYYHFPQNLIYGTWYQKQVILQGAPLSTQIIITKLKSSQNTQSEYVFNECLNAKRIIKFKFMIPHHDHQTHQVIYRIQIQNSQTFYFQIRGKSKLPQIQVCELVDFGLIKTNITQSSFIKLSNPNKIPLNIKIMNAYKYYLPQYSYIYEYQQTQCQNISKRFWIQQEQFTLQPLSTKQIPCKYSSQGQADSLNDTIQVTVQNGISSSFQLRVQVQQIHVILSNSYYNLKELFVNNSYSLKQLIKSKNKLQLFNLGNIDAQFKWSVVQNIDCRFQFNPHNGVVKAKSKLEIEVKIVPLRNSKTCHKVKCQIQGCQDLVVSFDTTIKGLEIRYALVNEELATKVVVKENLDLSKTDRTKTNRLASLTSSISYLREKDKQITVYPELKSVGFFNCQINIPKQIEILLENHSDLDTQFNLKALKYLGLDKKVGSQIKSDFPGKTAAFSSEMGATFIAKRQLQKSQKEYLKQSSHGVSIICQPDKGLLKGGSQVKIKIILFNNICGRFQDELQINITNYDTKLIPIDIDIKGTPIGVSKNQLGINFNSIFPIFKLGCFITKSGTVRKQFKVVNKAPRPVQLHWKIYSLDKPQTEDPFQITISPPMLGSSDTVSTNWKAIQPQCQKDSLFSIYPFSKTIQPQQQVSFTISFLTLENPQQSKCMFIGEPYLLNETQKIKMQLMPIIAQAQSVQPKLKLDKYMSNLADDNLVILEKYAGEESGKDIKSIILQNPTGSNLICSFESLNNQFKIIDTSTNSGSNNLLSKTQSQFTKSLSKSIGGAKVVESCFNVAPGSYVQLKLKFDCDIKNSDDWPAASKFRKEGKIKISYSNEDSEQINLLGQLYRPILTLNTSGKQGSEADQIIDFGVVHIKNDKKKIIYLSNISPVKGKWMLKYVKFPAKRKFQQILWTKLDQQDISITDDKDCFNFSINQGTVQSMTIPIKTMPNTLALPAPDDQYAKTHVSQKIMIAFKPKKDVLYKSRFKILVDNGQPIEFVLRGMGTYEQQYLK